MTETLPLLTQRVSPPVLVAGVIRLPFEARQKCRQRVTAQGGEALGIVLERGETLADGDCLLADDGRVFRIEAAEEWLSTVGNCDGTTLARAAYHLGNRHARVQVLPGEVRYIADHVFDEMLARLGHTVERVLAPFEVEPGAYHEHGRAGRHQGSHRHVTEVPSEHDTVPSGMTVAECAADFYAQVGRSDG